MNIPNKLTVIQLLAGNRLPRRSPARTRAFPAPGHEADAAQPDGADATHVSYTFQLSIVALNNGGKVSLDSKKIIEINS